MTKKTKGAGRIHKALSNKDKLNHLVSLLARDPWASKQDQVSVVGARDPDVLRKTWWRKLENEKLAVVNPVLRPDKVRESFQRFWVFIQTQYDATQADVVRDELGDTHRYQEWICKRLEELLREQDGAVMRCGGAEVLLGGGGWDIIFIIDTQDERRVHDFVVRHVRTCPHVATSSTAWSIAKGAFVQQDVKDSDE